jgi:hypothetical protein
MFQKIKYQIMKYRRRWDFFWLSELWKKKYRAIGIDPVSLEEMERKG